MWIRVQGLGAVPLRVWIHMGEARDTMRYYYVAAWGPSLGEGGHAFLGPWLRAPRRVCGVLPAPAPCQKEFLRAYRWKAQGPLHTAGSVQQGCCCTCCKRPPLLRSAPVACLSGLSSSDFEKEQSAAD